jgi:ribosomal-protein-alanine N-acetyltransferase
MMAFFLLLKYVMIEININTENLKLFLPKMDQADLALDYFIRNRDYLTPTNPVLPPDFFTKLFWEKRLGQNISEYHNDQSARLFIEHKQIKNKFIGIVNFTQITRGPFQACSLGYSIDKEFQGQGVMFEALSSAIKYIFDEKHLHRIMANYLPENQRSGQLLNGLGFTIDGTSQDFLFINGEWRTHVLSSLTNRNWSPRDEDKSLFLEFF